MNKNIDFAGAMMTSKWKFFSSFSISSAFVLFSVGCSPNGGFQGLSSESEVFLSASSAECVDPDGDGWGWDGTGSCKVSNSNGGGGGSVDDCVDPDGDGWGWSNTTGSCKVSDNTGGNNNNNGNSGNTGSNCHDPDGDGWGWDGTGSCRVTTNGGGGGGNRGPASDGVLFSEDFSGASVGAYEKAELHSDFGDLRWEMGFYTGQGTTQYHHSRTSITNQGGSFGNALRVKYLGNQYGPSAGAQFPMEIPGNHEELYLSYQLKFGAGFDFKIGGKLPGFCGYHKDMDPSTGCKTGGGRPSTNEGWSARVMWRENGGSETYLYSPGQVENYGDRLTWNHQFRANQWYRIEQRIKLNNAGSNNGIIEVWINGSKVYGVYNARLRDSNSIKINTFYFSTFYGGADSSWAPSSDQYADFDDIIISTKPIN